MEDSKSWAVHWLRSFSVCVQSSENESKQQLSLSKWRVKQLQTFSAQSKCLCLWNHAWRTRSARYCCCCTSTSGDFQGDHGGEKKISLIRLQLLLGLDLSESVMLCGGFLLLNVSKRAIDSCLSSGWEKFSPRRILSGPGGEGLSGPSTTSPRTRGAQNDRGGPRCVPSLRKETAFLWITTFLEPQPRVRSAQRSGKVYLRTVGRILKKRNHFTSKFEQSKTVFTFFRWTRSCSGWHMFDSAAGDPRDLCGVDSIVS